MPTDLLFHGGDILTGDPDRPLVRNGAIAVTGGKVAALGPAAEIAARHPAHETVEFAGMLMPGLVDGHTHLFQTAGKTLGDGLTLLPWLQTFMMPLAFSLSRENAVRIVRMAALHSLLSGTTTVLDNHYAPVDEGTILDCVAALDGLGLRGVVARGIFGRMGEGARRMNCVPGLFRHSPAEEIEITRACIAAVPPGSRVAVWPMPENIVYVEPELIAACDELARDHGLGWQMHCSESRFEVEIFTALHGIRPALWLQREGLLSDRVSLAHGIWFDEAEIEALGAGGATVVHNPVSNQYLASGIVKMGPLLDAGANVALGTDGTAVGGQTMFEAMKAALLMQRLRELDSSATTAEMMLGLATSGGARLLRQGSGRLRAGEPADFVVVDTGGLHHQPATRPATGLVLSATGGDVRHVVVAGEVVVRDGRSTRVDHEQVLSDGLQATREVLAQAGLR